MNDRYWDDLKAYLDGELSPVARLAVRLHLTHCASCREELTQMTRIAEDLRETEMDGALDPGLREKLLGIGPVSDRIGAGGPSAPNSGGRGGERHERLSSPTPPELRAGGRKRLPLGWAIAGMALVGWFLCYPAFQHTQQYVRQAQAVTAPMGAQRITAEHMARIKVFKPAPKLKSPPPPKPVTFTVRLSDREAGTADGRMSLQIKNPGSQLQWRATGAALNNASSNATGNATAADTAGDALRQVHKEASIGVQVPNPETTSDTVETMVKETGGYVAENNLSTGDDQLKSAEMTVKVPVAQFDTFLARVAKLGNVQSKNVTGEDITEQTSDADQTENVLEDDVQKSEARLKALGSRAKWHDEQATRDLRIQLAQSRARLILLKRMATLGTITVDLSQTPPKAVTPPVTGSFLNGLKASTHDALQSLVSSASALVALGIWLLAYAPIWLPLLLGGRYVMREYRKRQTA